MPELRLTGCTPEPLMGYLKALGVFRLVAEQCDRAATFSWCDGLARLNSCFDHDGIVQFFMKDYQPTPIVVPWSGGDFFGINLDPKIGKFKKAPTSTKAIESVLATDSPRLQPYRDTIRLVVDSMRECKIFTKADVEGASNKSRKAAFIARLRAWLPEDVVDWIDAAAQPSEASAVFNPLLGSGGGNDGNTHFSDNFMQSLWDCMDDFDGQRQDTDKPKPDIRHALFNTLAGKLVERTGALYDSGAVGGPNATQGFIREFLVNPWNFILAIEGLLLFAGGVAKKLGSHSNEAPSFPFLIRMTAAGADFGSAALKEYGQYEVWLPLWNGDLTLAETCAFFRESRAQVGRRPAQTGTDMSRAVSTRGVSAGIDEFCRYGLIRGRVGGENYFTATSIGRYRVHFDESVTLLDQLDPWLTKFNYALRDDDTPARYRSVFHQLDSAITDHCRGQSPGRRGPLLPVLLSLAKVERALSSGHRFCKDKGIRPLAGLSSEWLAQADDGSPEFRLAASLAGLRGAKDVGPLRVFLEEVEMKGSWVNWSPGTTSAVWSTRPLADNLAAVFRRRQMEAFRAGHTGVPLDSARPTRLEDVVAFLTDPEFDDDKLHDLTWGLCAINWAEVEPGALEQPSRERELEVPFEYGLPRLVAQPRLYAPFNGYWQSSRSGAANAVADPEVFNSLACGRADAITDCVDRAARRLKSGGLLAVGYQNRRRPGKSLAVLSPFHPTRLLAAMLFPLAEPEFDRLANAVLNYPVASE